MKSLVMLLFKAFLLVLYPLGYLMPRRKNLCILGGGHDTFTDNPKHLYLYFSEEVPEIDAVWITKKKEIYDSLKDRGLKVELYQSFRGIWTCLRAKYFFYNISLYDVNFYASAGATIVNLWHGTPIKAIGFDVKAGPFAQQKKINWQDRILRPFNYMSPDFFLSSSQFATEKIFKSAFRLTDKSYLPWGYPRSDIFFKSKNEITFFIEKHEGAAIQSFIKELKSFDQSFIYLPTFRDSNIDFIEQAGIDLVELNAVMKRKNAVFIFKMHPKTSIDLSKVAEFSHLKILHKEADIYTFLPFTDCLITDYSSVYFDYLLLEKRLVLFPFDLTDYLKNNRNLYFEFDKYMVGEQAMNFQELVAAIAQEEVPVFSKQEEIRSLFWDDYEGGAAEKIARWVLKH